MSRRMVKTGSVHVAAKNLEYNRQPLCGQNNVSKRCVPYVSNARCQKNSNAGLNFGERSKFAVATFLSLAVCYNHLFSEKIRFRAVLRKLLSFIASAAPRANLRACAIHSVHAAASDVIQRRG